MWLHGWSCMRGAALTVDEESEEGIGEEEMPRVRQGGDESARVEARHLDDERDGKGAEGGGG